MFSTWQSFNLATLIIAKLKYPQVGGQSVDLDSSYSYSFTLPIGQGQLRTFFLTSSMRRVEGENHIFGKNWGVVGTSDFWVRASESIRYIYERPSHTTASFSLCNFRDFDMS